MTLTISGVTRSNTEKRTLLSQASFGACLGNGCISVVAGNAVLSVLGVLCGFLNQCWDLTAEDAEDAEEQRDNERPTH